MLYARYRVKVRCVTVGRSLRSGSAFCYRAKRALCAAVAEPSKEALHSKARVLGFETRSIQLVRALPRSPPCSRSCSCSGSRARVRVRARAHSPPLTTVRCLAANTPEHTPNTAPNTNANTPRTPPNANATNGLPPKRRVNRPRQEDVCYVCSKRRPPGRVPAPPRARRP